MPARWYMSTRRIQVANANVLSQHPVTDGQNGGRGSAHGGVVFFYSLSRLVQLQAHLLRHALRPRTKRARAPTTLWKTWPEKALFVRAVQKHALRPFRLSLSR